MHCPSRTGVGLSCSHKNRKDSKWHNGNGAKERITLARRVENFELRLVFQLTFVEIAIMLNARNTQALHARTVHSALP